MADSVAYISRYSNSSSKWKALITGYNYNASTTATLITAGLTSGYWKNTAAITSITVLESGGGGLTSGTTLSLYGYP
jgi:hypothetical protein